MAELVPLPGGRMPTPTKTGTTVLTPEVRQRIIQAISRGLTRKLAAQFAGIHPASIETWLRRGEEEGAGWFFEFAVDLRRAESIAADKWIGAIEAHMEDDWKAASFLLERRFPEEYGRSTPATQQQGSTFAELALKLVQESPDGTRKEVTLTQRQELPPGDVPGSMPPSAGGAEPLDE